MQNTAEFIRAFDFLYTMAIYYSDSKLVSTFDVESDLDLKGTKEGRMIQGLKDRAYMTLHRSVRKSERGEGESIFSFCYADVRT